ncbi:3798_t:CDS:2, partial [Scutellospora calospora]
KEVFISTTETIPESLFYEVENWSIQEGLVTLKPPYTIQRYERVIPYKNSEEFLNAELNKKEKWYVLDELEEGKMYETRVSYASTSPTNFVLNILDVNEVMKILRKNNVTDDEQISHPKLDTTKKFLRVRAIYDGVSIYHGRDSRAVIYNVVLETLVYGVPRVAFNLVFVLIIIIGVGIIVVPKIYKALRNFIEEKDKKE